MLGSLWFGSFSSGAGGAGDYELISTTVLGSSAASVTFSSTAAWANYKHLQIRWVARTDRAVTEDGATIMYLNSDTTAGNYRTHYLVGTGTNAVSYDNGTGMGLGSFPGASSGANQFEPMITDLLDFSSTTKNKTIRMSAGNAGSYTSVRLASGAWFSTAAVTSIQISSISNNWVTGSRFSLYGLRG